MGLRKRKQSAGRLPEDVPLADYGADENITDNVKIQWVNQPWVRTVLRGAAIISFISVCLNTPKTFETKIGEFGSLEFLRYVTLVVDSIVTLLLALEMVAKMHMRGIFKVGSQDCFNSFEMDMMWKNHPYTLSPSLLPSLPPAFHLYSISTKNVKEIIKDTCTVC